MGQEASVPSKQGVLNDLTLPVPSAASPQAAASSSPEESSTTNSTAETLSSHPQARKKLPSSIPSPVANGATTSSSIMSRAGLTSMIQRMGGPSTAYNTNHSKQKSKKAPPAEEKEQPVADNGSAGGASVGKMTDLVLGEPPQRNETTHNKKTQPSDEDDWEKAWAEDSESDEEEEPPPAPIGPDSTPNAAEMSSLRIDALSPVGHTVSENFRPDLDAGHSSMGMGIDLGEVMMEEKMAQRGERAMSPKPQQMEMAKEEEGDQHALREDWEGYHHEIHPVAAEVEQPQPCVDMFDPALRVLGRGSFGRVVLVQKRYGQSQGGLYAMKILRKSHLVRRRQIERTKTERKVLSMLNHPFIMKLYYAFQTTEKLYLVLDYCPGGELFFHLSRYRRFQEPVARFYAAELLLAIGHLHKHGIIYRDLKPENVLLDAYGHVKLGDFGLAKDGIRHPTQGAKSTCGTPEYMAPEVLNQTGHGFCVDYWGLGMILYEMMTGLPPWYTTDRSKLFRRLRSAPLIFPNEVQFSPHCKACIAGLLERDPRLRLGVLGLRSAMRHEFFYRRINFDALRDCQIAAPIRPCEGWRQFTNKNNNGEGNDALSGSLRGHSAGPSYESAAMGQITMELLDVATENFDDTFRRMPIETEDYEKQQQASGHAPITENELNSQTFRGFTFDGDELLEDETPHDPWKQQQESHNHQQQHQQQLYHHHQQRHTFHHQQQQHVQHSQNPGDRGEIT